MTQTIYVRCCYPGPGLRQAARVAGRGSLISPGVAGRGARVGNPPRLCQPCMSQGKIFLFSLSPRLVLRPPEGCPQNMLFPSLYARR